MLVTLEGERVVNVAGDRDHPFTDGFLCHKVSRLPERIHHPDRLLFPMKRTGPKGSGQFERVSWDVALDEIASRFQDIAAGQHGPQSILPYSYCGTMGKIQGESLDRRFFGRLGASLLDRTICATAGGVGYRYTIGSVQGTDPEAFPHSRYIINWGSNTAVTNSHLWAKMVHAQKHNGARIVTIDPHRSHTAKRSDWHVAPRPGTDAALALGASSLIVDTDAHEELVPEGELQTEWLTTDYEIGDTLIFPALTMHKALPNLTEDRLRVSLDNRYQRVGDPIAEHMLNPHLSSMSPLSWDEVYADWDSDEFQYYWKKFDTPVLPKITEYLDKAFDEAVELAQGGDDRAKLHLRRLATRDPESDQGQTAATVLAALAE